MSSLFSQLPDARPSWHSSAPLGLPDLVCACLPSGLRLLVREVSSTVPYRPLSRMIAGTLRQRKLQEVRDTLTLSTRILLCHSDTPEVTWRATVTTGGTSTTFSSTASGSGSSLTFSPTPSGSHPSSTSISHTSPNRGRMEGGTIGGVVGATLIGVVVWFVRRRRARRVPSITDTRGEMEQPVPYPPAIKMPKLYVSLYSLFLYSHQVWNESCN